MGAERRADGGAGVAEPASSWIFTMASTFFFGGIVRVSLFVLFGVCPVA